MLFASIMSEIQGIYAGFYNSLGPELRTAVSLISIVIVMVIYSIFIWKFYRFIAKKDIFSLNLSQYNKFHNSLFVKLSASIFYFLEYLIIMPFIIFFWFVVFSVFLIILIESGTNTDTSSILLISAAIVSAIRMTAYYSEDLSRDLAKMIPFTLLGIAIINTNFLSFDRVVSRVSEVPGLINTILIYLIFIIVLEMVLRLLDFILSFFISQPDGEVSGEK